MKKHLTPLPLYIVRTWKRDGSRNLMGVVAAAENLGRHASSAAVRKLPDQDRVDLLLQGHTVHTALAFFQRDGQWNGD